MANVYTSVWTKKPKLQAFCEAKRREGMNDTQVAVAASRKFRLRISRQVVQEKLVGVPRGIRELTDAELPVEEQVSEDKRAAIHEARANDYKRRYEALLDHTNAEDKLLGMAEQTLSALPKVPAPKLPKGSGYRTTESAVLVGSCWHVGEKINLEEMGGLNEYNFDIFVRRLQHLVETTIKFTTGNMSNHVFEDVHVFLTGDMVSGIIHDELEQTNELNIVDQAFLGALVTAQALLDLARTFPKVIVTCVVGNHGRTKQEKQFKGKATVSWDRVFYETLALLLKNQANVQFLIPKSYWAQVEVQGHLFQVQHGDTVRSALGIPFYGLKREQGKWMEINAVQKRFVRYTVLSHFHTKAILQSGIGEMIMNGSLKGGDEYAIGLGLYGEPVQLLFGVHPTHGKSWELSINAKEPNVDVRYRYDIRKSLAAQLDLV